MGNKIFAAVENSTSKELFEFATNVMMIFNIAKLHGDTAMMVDVEVGDFAEGLMSLSREYAEAHQIKGVD